MSDFTQAVLAARRRGGRSGRPASPMQRREARWGYAFISPWIIGFVLFWAVPIAASLVFSTLDFQLTDPDATAFAGGSNWERALSDPDTWSSLAATFRFTVLFLPLSLIVALGLALLLNSKYLKFTGLFRLLFFMPSMIPLVAGILIWQQVLNPQTGWVNELIGLTGADATGSDGIRWLDNPVLVLFAFSFIGLWGIGNSMIVNLAGLQGIPTELYEAAQIDGAGWWRRLRAITLPLLSPILFYNLVIGSVLVLQYFVVPWVLFGASGRPDGASRFLLVHFYQEAFVFGNMGYGAALAWLIFIVVAVLTGLLFGTARYWVHYGTERS
ncbi:carbohydrate ABC transporter permease [Glycomyces algeriensis]|uniref:ABC transporter n=1 Tax=Glycomyces algeriensis TaxID=256037 RepID=A0A9W6GB40_9ACTN|nr:sugar ABC transporter permease [Glycomyces algeriensis]MDA1364727.1 sugar ABC transporter permease [Glycomyces algeriensis]MDR7350768.1 multiple sugar transport system permease protein [Glycomyces algeriensis]GLI43478.1 ABC transporter [Glycomyces algeriensis]